MALNLDTRQRAMLQEMGITVWLRQALESVTTAPLPTTAAPRPSPAQAQETVAVAVAPAVTVPAAATVPSAPAAVVRSALPPTPTAVPVAHEAITTTAQDWRMAPAVAAYAQTTTSSSEPAWLVVCESADPAHPLAGEAGKLLDNMLRALRLHLRGQVWIAAVQRPGSDALPVAALPAAPVEWQPLQQGLTECIQQKRPARVLVLGVHAARAVLGSQEALGRLRAQVHHVHQIPVVVSYDPAYLLRSPHAKPAAWADWCRAYTLQPPP